MMVHYQKIAVITVWLGGCLFIQSDSLAQCKNRTAFYELEIDCAKKHSDKSFISDGQQYRHLFEQPEVREFFLPFYGGNKYRIAVCTDIDDGKILFTVKDHQGNLLFSNKDQGNAPFWDLEFPSSIDCKIEMEIAPETWEKAGSGKAPVSDGKTSPADTTAKAAETPADKPKVSICATMLIGYKQ